MSEQISFIFAQSISVITAALSALALQLKNMKQVLMLNIIANLLGALSFVLLGAYPGAAISSLAVFHVAIMYVYNKKGKKPGLPVIILFIILYILCSLLSYSSLLDILPVLAAACFAVGTAQENSTHFRFWNFMNPVFWMIYDLSVRAYGNFAVHVIIFISIVVGILRIDLPIIRKKRTAQ